MKIFPYDNKVIMRKVKPGMTPGGIIIPEKAESPTPLAEVVAVGPGISKDKPMSVKVNDIVMYDFRFVTGVFIDGEEFLVAREGDAIIGRVEY